MPRNIRRPAGLPWTHAVEPTEASAFAAGLSAGKANTPLPPILSLDRHAWRGVLRVCPRPSGALGEQWRAFIADAAWCLPENEREGDARHRAGDLATPDDALIAEVEGGEAKENRPPTLTSPSDLPPAP